MVNMHAKNFLGIAEPFRKLRCTQELHQRVMLMKRIYWLQYIEMDQPPFHDTN